MTYTPAEARTVKRPRWARPVFPGAEGFGTDTPAGRGGRIVPVTSLASSGRGTLREALAEPGPRVVVFEVGGVIDLAGESLEIDEPLLTVAGQTAPPPGITLIRGGITVRTHDVLIQHLRVRPGDAEMPKDSGWEPDGITTTSNPAGDGRGPHRVVIDHCSVSWGVDENLSVSGYRHRAPSATSHRVTLSNCIIAEGLHDSTHPKGWHSKGTLIHDKVRDVTVTRCLYASNEDRNPVLKPGASAVVTNNLIYNPGRRAIASYWPLREYEGRLEQMRPCELVAIANLLWRGPDTPATAQMFDFGEGQARTYLRDNYEQAHDTAGPSSYREPGFADTEPMRLDEAPLWPEGLTLLPVDQTAEHVLHHAGAWPAARDAIDHRIVASTRDRTGRIIDSQAQVGGYPCAEPTRHKLTPPANPHAIEGDDGYTNLEIWLHRLAKSIEA